MILTIVYDNTIYKKNLGLKSDWGFSCLIENKDELVLFDTGANGEILLNNMKKLNINFENISKIIISHEHYDHNGGLQKITSFLKDVKVYRFKDEKQRDDIDLICVNKPIKISDNIYSTGRMQGDPVDEQSLILKCRKGWFILAGCSHNKVKNIIKKAREYGDIKGIIGGFHGFSEFNILENMALICPTHCTKYKEKIYDTFPDKTKKGGVGKIFDL